MPAADALGSKRQTTPAGPGPVIPPQVYIDANGNRLWGQRGYLQYRKEKGEPLSGPCARAGGGVRKRSGGSGRKRKVGGRKAGGAKRARKK